MFTQLDPPLWFSTPKGIGLAHAVIDYGPEHDLIWVCFQEETGQVWSWSNPQVRALKNITMGRTNPDIVIRETPSNAKL